MNSEFGKYKKIKEFKRSPNTKLDSECSGPFKPEQKIMEIIPFYNIWSTEN